MKNKLTAVKLKFSTGLIFGQGPSWETSAIAAAANATIKSCSILSDSVIYTTLRWKLTAFDAVLPFIAAARHRGHGHDTIFDVDYLIGEIAFTQDEWMLLEWNSGLFCVVASSDCDFRFLWNKRRTWFFLQLFEERKEFICLYCLILSPNSLESSIFRMISIIYLFCSPKPFLDDFIF